MVRKKRENIFERLGKVEPVCKHFWDCGGCRYQDIEYPSQQMILKSEYLTHLLKQPIEVIPSPVGLGYRNKMEFVCAFGKVGLRKRKTFDAVIDVEYCHYISERSNKLLKELKELIKKNNIEDYDYLEHIGYLRYIVLREAKFTDDIMISFVTSTKSEEVLALVDYLKDKVSSIQWIINEGMGDRATGELYKSWGKDFFVEKVCGLEFKVGPNSFFQNNAFLMDKLYAEVEKNLIGDKILDLYCGIGSITLAVAGNGRQVHGVEIVEQAIDYAKENQKLNKVENVSFECLDVKEWVKNPSNKNYDTIILDPPRAGNGKKTIRHLSKMDPKRFVLVSCNPKSLKDDLKFFKEEGYVSTSIKGYDMFPQTPHIEVVVVLDKAEKSEEEIVEN